MGRGSNNIADCRSARSFLIKNTKRNSTLVTKEGAVPSRLSGWGRMAPSFLVYALASQHQQKGKWPDVQFANN